MKWTAIVVLFLYSATVFAQTGVREYFNHRGETCAPEISYYYSIGKKNSRGFFYDSLKSYYSKSNTLKSVEVRDQFGNRRGYYETFYENGTLKSKSRYERKAFRLFDSVQDSSEFVILDFNDSLGHPLVKNGEGFVRGRLDFLWEQGKVVQGQRDSVWTVYYDNGKVYSYESWEGGQLIDGMSYDEAGKEYYFKEFMVLPTPTEGLSEFCDELANKVSYPRDAQRRGIEGKIIIEFSVEKDGSITAPHIRKGIGFGCDEEAIKALTSSPRWQPCRQRGQPVKYKMTIPFLFKLS